MLFGKHPWNGPSQTSLVNSIKSDPLSFPNDIMIS